MPCRKRMVGCKTDCLHRALVNEYRLARLNDEQHAEAASIGYATEYAEYVAAHPLITFQEWLIGHRKPQEVAA